ncbi:TPA: YkgJ family cysteine cluster protein, partial [Klebsiella pneumoniae]
MNSNPRMQIAEISLIYGFLDTFGEFASTFTVCQKGCSACCKIGVEMTALEASFIEKNTSHRIVSNKQRKLKTNTDCPFLIDGICSIYEYRPFNCRTFFTVDNPKYCETPNEPHRTYGSLGGQDINIIYQFRKYIDHLNGKRKKSDIRFFFG